MEQGFFSFRSGLDAARKLLATEPAPTAIFASNDDMAAAVNAEAHRRDLDVPRDLTVVGFDDTLIASTIWPELTTIQPPIARMAREAIDMLVAAVRGGWQAGAAKSPGAILDRASRSEGLGAGMEPSNRVYRLIAHALIARESAAAPRFVATSYRQSKSGAVTTPRRIVPSTRATPTISPRSLRTTTR